MRVVAGFNRGMRLKMVPSKLTRPTTDKVKEALFSIIEAYINNAIVLDLYSGSGALGIESVSRGARQAYLVDHARPAIEVIKENVSSTHQEKKFEIIKAPASKALDFFSEQKIRFDLVLLDPPYAKQHMINDILEMKKRDLLNEGAMIACESDLHGYNSLNGNIPDFLELYTKKKYGITYLTIFHMKEN
ncbi:16S rRNA (guanine(966)-N(2))-methyltransferase RsmD [Oenococcus alcoholitolerans]|uniref:16S rRNA (guanine(966)-N(2))-methyltransferase RsmD n=1 Tax=Oenococcus alcoholitolerans TaxID=931074 RepID=UPI003F70CAB7